ncbi:serine carboxypeptidase-like 7 [Abrus precatorius]|uniref:Serine carboxypeptidase-like 7 n=1 Tax=Abrus precatorius TaxID=3816 RepID=A0A8B8KM76_ABRPR|nr:serine carboxypeptidase-like 7 [Abrus precatorius]
MARVSKAWCILVTTLHLLHIASSNFIVKSLPGFGHLPFTLETGYVGVDEREEVQLFYYFVESERSPMNDPLLLWLIGGPGCSGLSGFLYENGPLMLNYDKVNGTIPELRLNPNSWSKVLNILYVDAPIGTGFSYSKTQQGYYTNDKQTVEHIYDFLQKWLVDHPKFQSNPAYIGGGSYAGLFVPPLVQKVYEGYKAGYFPLLNFKGFVLASALLDTYLDFNARVQYSQQRTLISNELYESMKANCNGDYININPNNTNCMSDYEVYSETDKFTLSDKWANDPNVRKNLNVREGTKGGVRRCNITDAFIDAYTKNVPSVVEYLQSLTTTNLRSLIYIGDLDMDVPYLSTHSIIKSQNMKLSSSWRAWFIGGEVAGYTEEYERNEYHLTYVTVKGGSHVVQYQKPREAYEIIRRWFSYYDI